MTTEYRSCPGDKKNAPVAAQQQGPADESSTQSEGAVDQNYNGTKRAAQQNKREKTKKHKFRYLTGKKECPLSYLPRVIYSLLYQGKTLNQIEREQGINRSKARDIIKNTLLPLGLVVKERGQWLAIKPPKEWFVYTRADDPAYLRVVASNAGASYTWSSRLLYSFLRSQAVAKRMIFAPYRGRSYYSATLGIDRQSVKRALADLARGLVRLDGSKAVLIPLEKSLGDHSELVATWCARNWIEGYDCVMKKSAGHDLATIQEKLSWVAGNWDREKYASPKGLIDRVFRPKSK